MIKQHIMMKDETAYLSDYPHLKAHLVAQMHVHGNIAIEAVAEHYRISLADVYATIAYYYDNQEKIETAHSKKLERARQIGKDNFRESKG